MKEPKIRKIVTNVEEVFLEGGADMPVETNSGRKSIIPSNEKVAGVGASLDISLHFKDAAFVRTHYGSCEIRVPDAPRADEIIMAVVLADAGRPHALVNGQGRIGGLQKWEAKCEDGNR